MNINICKYDYYCIWEVKECYRLYFFIQIQKQKRKSDFLSDITFAVNKWKWTKTTQKIAVQTNSKGLVNGDRHKEIIETHLWMNPSNNQWAIVFVYKEIDRSCVIGGNNIKLYSPK